MKIRYCHANNFKNPSCPVGWGTLRWTKDTCLGGGMVIVSESCADEPKERNCKYLVDDESEIEYCPTCGTALEIKDNKKREPLLLFGTHLKEAWEVIKYLFNK